MKSNPLTYLLAGIGIALVVLASMATVNEFRVYITWSAPDDNGCRQETVHYLYRPPAQYVECPTAEDLP